MQKTVLTLFIIFLVIISFTYVFYNNIQKKNDEIIKDNNEYVSYLDKSITGTDLATLINKAMNQNEENNIKKDEDNHYIENETNSLKIEVKMSQTNLSYSMEEFYNNDISKFVEYFSNANFKCTNIEYHRKSGQVKKMLFEQTN